ncbi:MAG: TolC family protein, partial [Aquifex sp.]
MWVILLIPAFLFSLGLEELWKSALNKNPEILSQREDVKAKEYRLKALKNLYLPLFEVQYSRVWLSEKQRLEVFPFSVDITKKSFENYSFSLKELLYDFGRRERLIEISERKLKASKYLYEEKRQEVLYKVAEAYLNLLSVKGKIRIYEEELKAVRSQYELAKAYYEKGLVAITDVLQARVRMQEVKEKLRRERGNLETLLVYLSNLTGMNKERLRKLNEIKGVPEIREFNYYLKLAYERRGILKVQKERISILENFSKVKVSEYLPQFFGGITYHYTDQNPSVEPKGYLSYFVGSKVSFQTL